MKYKFLRKFLRLRDDESAIAGGSSRAFDCGIGYYYCLGGLAITKGLKPDIHNVVFVLQVNDQSKAWRERLDRHTSSAEYDLIVTQSKPQTQAIAP